MDDDEIAALTTFGEQLIDAILNEQAKAAKDFVEKGAPLWYQNEAESMSALHAAAYVQNEELVEYLIQKGAIWSAGNFLNAVLLRLAASMLTETVDDLNHTAGDIALSFNNETIYTGTFPDSNDACNADN